MSTQVSIAILAAGLGTRMKSKKAKVLHHAGGRALIEHVVASACELAAPEHIVAVVGHQAEQVRAAVQHTGVRFTVQSEQRGTGHALLCCREILSGQPGILLVLYGDTPLLSASTLRRLIAEHTQHAAAGTVIVTRLDDPAGYGRVLMDGHGNIYGIVEQKVASEEQRKIQEINSGIYAFDAPLLWDSIAQIQPNPVSNEYYLTDIVEILNRGGRKVRAMMHEDASELLGINTRAELSQLDEEFRSRTVARWMEQGVTIEQPGTVTIDTTVSIGMDTTVEAFAQLRGHTVIGENCRIGAGAIIRNSRLGDGVEIAPYTLIDASEVAASATIGPFARLRQNNRVAARAHIGNFVELKNASLGEGTKAGHLAYLGDTEIGAGSNIGAGTITCNYDGRKKHRTKIGDKAFIGSNATLVAPVEIGSGSYVAAASIVTEEVPPDALAIGRGKQVNKPGWAAKRR